MIFMLQFSMKISTIINRIKTESDLETFLNYLETAMNQGTPLGVMASQAPISIGVKTLIQLLDLWYPGYAELPMPEKRQWVLTHYPLIHRDKNWRTKLYDPDHPIFKHFTHYNGVNFHGQKSMALKRGIEFKFDFLSWIVWWIQTGHFDQRGVGNDDYQMCRKGDIGPYNWDNVYCDTGKNNKDAYWLQKDK
jgi:hypothetical protein